MVLLLFASAFLGLGIALIYYLKVSSIPLTQGIENTEVEVFTCDLCSDAPKFPTRKALQQHSRIKHKVRNPMRHFILDSTSTAKDIWRRST